MEQTTILYAGQSFVLPTKLTGDEALKLMQSYRPEIGGNGDFKINADGTISVFIKAQQKSAWFVGEGEAPTAAAPATEATTILYAGQTFNLPTKLSGDEALKLMQSYRPEIGNNGDFTVNADGTISVFIKAQQKSC